MNEIGFLIVSFIAGFLLGAFFFGGLWWTTKKAVLSKSPALWFFASLFIRLGATITGFYFIGHGHWERMLICLLGFIIARAIGLRITQVPEIKQNE
jgi:F1F0 ATPase subunit 2